MRRDIIFSVLGWSVALLLLSRLPRVMAQQNMGGTGGGTPQYPSGQPVVKCSPPCNIITYSCVFGIIGIFMIAVCTALIWKKRKQRKKQQEKQQIWLQQQDASAPLTDISIAETSHNPSSSFQPCDGIWYGTYHCESAPNYGDHDISVTLTFNHDDHTLKGISGHDNHGSFTLDGIYHNNRITWIENYKCTTCMCTRRDHMKPLYLGNMIHEKYIQGRWELANGEYGNFELRHESMKQQQANDHVDAMDSVRLPSQPLTQPDVPANPTAAHHTTT